MQREPHVWFGILADKMHLSLSFSLATLVLAEMQLLSGERNILVGLLCTFGVLLTHWSVVGALERVVVLTTVQWYSQQLSVLWRGTQEPQGNLVLTAPMLALAGACTCTWAAQRFAKRVIGAQSMGVATQVVSMTMLFVTTDVLDGLSKALPLPLLACAGLAYLVVDNNSKEDEEKWTQHMRLYLENIACRAVVSVGVFRVATAFTAGVEGILVLATAGAWFWSATCKVENARYAQCRSMYSYNLARQLHYESLSRLQSSGTHLALSTSLVALLSLTLPSRVAEKWWVADCVLVVTALQGSVFVTTRDGIQTMEQAFVYMAALCCLYKLSSTQEQHHNIAHHQAPHNLSTPPQSSANFVVDSTN